MLYWIKTPRAFNWFVEKEFNWLDSFPNYIPAITIIYFIILGIWILKTIYFFIKDKTFNIPKNAIIVGTYLSWYFGIVYFNNDLIFTLLNVISHGIPYIALIYIREIEQKETASLKQLSIILKIIQIKPQALMETLLQRNCLLLNCFFIKS